MPKIVFIEHNGTEHVVDAPVGKSIMQTAVDNMVPGIVGDCGGCCSCATCHGYIAEAWQDKLPEKHEDEIMMLEGALETRPTSRLTCQLIVKPEHEGLVISLPASQF